MPILEPQDHETEPFIAWLPHITRPTVWMVYFHSAGIFKSGFQEFECNGARELMNRYAGWHPDYWRSKDEWLSSSFYKHYVYENYSYIKTPELTPAIEILAAFMALKRRYET